MGTSNYNPVSPPNDDYAWAQYLIYMEAGAEMAPPAEVPKQYPVWEGVAFAAVLAIIAYSVVSAGILPKGAAEPVTIVLPLGILLGNVFKLPARLRPGIRYAVRSVLTMGIILLGARLNFGDILNVGAAAMLMSAAQVGLMLALSLLVRKAFGIGGKQATLLGIGTAICGGSAIIAAAPVIEAEERDIAFSVATVSFLGLATMFLLPFIASLLAMDPKSFGVWAGLAIHQTPQVVAAGFAFHPEAGKAATLVKLARVCLLAPLVLALSFAYRKKMGGAASRKQGWKDFLPPMVLGFTLLACLHSGGLIPVLTMKFPKWQAVTADLLDLSKTASGFLVAMGMAGVGLETSFKSLRTIGARPILAGVTLAAAGILFSFFAVRFFGV